MENAKQSQKKATAQKTRPVGTYGGSLARSLCLYSCYDDGFRRDFQNLIKKNIKIGKNEYAAGRGLAAGELAAILLPEGQSLAWPRALWLIKNKDLIAPDEQARLFAWAVADENPVPQQILVGFVGVAIPGPTLGLISRKKKVTMIMRKPARQLDKAELGEKIAALSLDIVSQALSLAGGEAANIEPEIAAWFFGERGLEFYEAEAAEFEKIRQEVADAKIVSSTAEIKGQAMIIAISPALNEHYRQSVWELKCL